MIAKALEHSCIGTFDCVSRPWSMTERRVPLKRWPLLPMHTALGSFPYALKVYVRVQNATQVGEVIDVARQGLPPSLPQLPTIDASRDPIAHRSRSWFSRVRPCHRTSAVLEDAEKICDRRSVANIRAQLASSSIIDGDRLSLR